MTEKTPANKSIYLDANATSRLRPEIQEAVALMLSADGIKNPSSVHGLGRNARMQLNLARKKVLKLLNLGEVPKNQRLVFTSGATEACNQMVLGFLGKVTELKGNGTIVTSSIEHPAVLEPIKLLESVGFKVKRINPAKSGIIDVAEFIEAVDEETVLVSLMTANNETGAIQPIIDVAKKLRAKNYNNLIISDFTQALGKTDLSLKTLFESGVNAVAVSGHKIGASAGIGALIINEGFDSACFQYEPILRGGAQETSYRAGTENLLGAICFGLVSEKVYQNLANDLQKSRELRELLWLGLKEISPELQRLTPEDSACIISNTLLVLFPNYRADDLLVALDLEGVFVSSGSACSSGKQGVSPVVTAMGYQGDLAKGALRLSLDWDATEADVREALIRVSRVISRIKKTKIQ